ncbi:MAG: methylmalonyl-CoA epimerase [Candidatus Schekmanbacteria bacterium]|nr:methylmalonyl-CoA epimerase [Candidatus Schekmanbacteria bacterium]
MHIDHIAIAVADLEAAIDTYRQLLGGADKSNLRRETVGDTETAFFSAGGTEIELVHGEEGSVIAAFLAKRGPGLHHLALRVDHLRSVLEGLRAAGIAVIEPAPRAGSRGTSVAFIHPRATQGVLVELVEHPALSKQSRDPKVQDGDGGNEEH